MLTIRRITADHVEELDHVDAGDLVTARDGAVLWVDLTEPEGDEHVLLRRMGLHPLVVDDLFDQTHDPKVDVYPDYVFAVVHGLDLDAVHLEFSTHELDVVLGRGWLITHAERTLDAVGDAAQRVERNPALAPTSGRLLYEVLDEMVEVYLPYLELVQARIDQIESVLFDDPGPELQAEIYLLRRDCIALRRVAEPQADAARRLATRADELLAPGDERWFADVQGQLQRISDLADSCRDLLDGALAQYQSAVANAQNEVMKVLTMVSAVLLPITVVAGIYGMNFEFMPELNQRWGYPAVMAVNVTIVLTALAFFRSRGWIGGRGRRAREREDTAMELRLPAVDRVLRLPALGRAEVRAAADTARVADARASGSSRIPSRRRPSL